MADLRRTGSLTYRADPVLAQHTEMILNNTAERQHIPGHAPMEAWCRMLIAGSRRFLMERRPGRHYYAVMQRFEIDFWRFVFPLPTYLELTI